MIVRFYKDKTLFISIRINERYYLVTLNAIVQIVNKTYRKQIPPF